MTDIQTAEWAGNKERQEQIAKAILRNYYNDHPVDIVGACESVLVSLIIPISKDRADAMSGVDQVCADMRATVEGCDKFRN